MSKHYQAIENQIEQLASLAHYRFANRLLKLAHYGHVKVEMACLIDIYGGSKGGTRRALGELQKANIIYYSIVNESICLIDFTSWPALATCPYPQNTVPENEKSAPDDLENARGDAEKRAPEGSFSRETEHSGATVGIGIGMVGRYIDPNTNTQYQELNTYLPNTVDHAHATNGHAAPAMRTNGHHAATREAEPEATLEQTALPPSSEAPPSPDVATDTDRIVALLTEPEIGVSPANAQRAAKLHTFAFVVRQVASWWDNPELGAGALFKNRLMNAKQFPPGQPSEDFLRSDVYDRHYPLQGDDREQWRLWQAHKDHIDQVEGLDSLQAWVDALPAPLKRTLGQLPLPKGGDA